MMDRLDYENKIEELLDEALSKLSVDEFDKLLSNIKDMTNNYY